MQSFGIVKYFFLWSTHATLISLRSRDVRTSQGTFMSREMDPDGVLAWVEDKLSVLTGIPTYHGEVLPPSCSSRLQWSEIMHLATPHAQQHSGVRCNLLAWEHWHQGSLLSPAARPEDEGQVDMMSVTCTLICGAHLCRRSMS